jgi:hypothetical protein
MSVVTSYQDYLDSFYALASAEPEKLVAVYEKITDKCREALALEFTTKTLLFTANPDDDTISVRSEDAPSVNTSAWTRLEAKKPWKSLIETEFGWGWVTINQQGYCDGILLSFAGLSPTIMLCVTGSSITVRRMVEEDDSIVSSKR